MFRKTSECSGRLLNVPEDFMNVPEDFRMFRKTSECSGRLLNVPEDFTLPTTPVLSTPGGSTSGLPRTGIEHRRLKYGPGLEHLERRNSNETTPPTVDRDPDALEKVGMDIDSGNDLQDSENALSGPRPEG